MRRGKLHHTHTHSQFTPHTRPHRRASRLVHGSEALCHSVRLQCLKCGSGWPCKNVVFGWNVQINSWFILWWLLCPLAFTNEARRTIAAARIQVLDVWWWCCHCARYCSDIVDDGRNNDGDNAYALADGFVFSTRQFVSRISSMYLKVERKKNEKVKIERRRGVLCCSEQCN